MASDDSFASSGPKGILSGFVADWKFGGGGGTSVINPAGELAEDGQASAT